MKFRFFSFRRLRRCSFPIRLAVLAGSTFLLLLVVSPLAFVTSGTAGLIAAGFAALACFVGTGIALWIAEFFGKSGATLASLLFGAIVRLSTPFAALWAVWFLASQYIDAGFVFYLPGFYVVTLWMEIMLSLPITDKES